MEPSAPLNATPAAALGDTPVFRPTKLIDQFREVIRAKHYARATEKTYWYWIKLFILFHHKRHPREMSASQVAAFLSYLALRRQVAASTQNQAMHALIFLYRQVLDVNLPWINGIVRAKPSQHIPTVLTQTEVRALLEHVHGAPGLVIRLLYGTGMRLMEGLRMRVMDVDFDSRTIVVRAGKGGKDRTVPLPGKLAQPLRDQISGYS